MYTPLCKHIPESQSWWCSQGGVTVTPPFLRRTRASTRTTILDNIKARMEWLGEKFLIRNEELGEPHTL